MTLAAAILAVALALPPPWLTDEQPAQYRDRVEVIAEAIALEAEDRPAGWHWGSTELAAAVLVTWYHESRFDRRVHAGEQHPVWTQDDMRARSLGQLHVSGLVPLHEWRRLAGVDLESTRRAARATGRVLTAHTRRCGVLRGPLTVLDRAKILRGYASGGECRPNASASLRAGAWSRVVQELRSRPTALARAE